MSYDEAIAFWFGRINYEVKAAQPEDLKLERMRSFLNRLGNPQARLRCVHLAGTKGKGSTAAMLGSVLQRAGYRVGLFTSPHLEHVEERIQVDEVPISKLELTALIAEIVPVALEMDAGPYSGPTFFEIITALGFLHFVRRRVDVAILEVGLGGRFDSTNVCQPLVSVITSIGYDHMAQLGDTLERIAFQKAGIIKANVPCISGVTDPLPRTVIRDVATAEHAPLIEIEKPYEGELNLLGEHQAKNAALAVAVVDQLRAAGLTISPSAVQQGLQTVNWHARIEVIRREPAVILDCAHNVPSAEALVKTLRMHFPDAARKHCVFAVSNDKQYSLILSILAGYFDHVHLTQYGNNPRCVPPATLAGQIPGTVTTTVAVPAETALRGAMVSAGEKDLICITGSVFLAGELAATLRATLRETSS
ncbi:folylpolyglutamate synthase/dihydrofolate synthase family protein [soil metagenome]